MHIVTTTLDIPGKGHRRTDLAYHGRYWSSTTILPFPLARRPPSQSEMHSLSDSQSHNRRSSSPKPTTSAVTKGFRRALGKRVSDTVELAIAKTAPSLLRSPRQVVNQIHRLCVKDQRTICQRHADFLQGIEESRFPEENMRYLKALCTKLLSFMASCVFLFSSRIDPNFGERNQGFGNVDYARDETLALVIRYPVVHISFLACLYEMPGKDLHYSAKEFRDLEKLKEMYNLWSTVIANLDQNQGTWNPTAHFCIVLKATFRHVFQLDN